MIRKEESVKIINLKQFRSLAINEKAKSLALPSNWRLFFF